MEKYLLSIVQGTTSSRAILFDHQSNVIQISQKEIQQYYPKPGWVEHDAIEIFSSVQSVMNDVIIQANIKPEQIEAIGITNQRETTVVWDKKTGLPVYHAIVWQSRQTSDISDWLKENNYDEMIQNKTGLLIDPYYSATKIKWILDHIEKGHERANNGELLFGTIDTWLLWKLTNGKVHHTDYSNASRTMMYNIYDLCWDQEILDLLSIPACMLPEVKPSSYVHGYTEPALFYNLSIPIASLAGDQQAALFGQRCFEPGMIKNTYGTGCFLLMNTGEKPRKSENGLVTTIAWGIGNKVEYALEGSIFVGGSVVQWLRDELHLISTAAQSEQCALSVEDTNGVVVVPAFVGLGAPYWNDKCQGAIFGITRGANANHIIRAALDSMAYQTKDIMDVMAKDGHVEVSELRVDGGATANNYLMQFQSDLLQMPVKRLRINETTALGAAYLAGLAVGYFKDQDSISGLDVSDTFEPKLEKEEVDKMYQRWQKAIQATMAF